MRHILFAFFFLSFFYQSSAQACQSTLFRSISKDVLKHGYTASASAEVSQRNNISSRALVGYKDIFNQTYHLIQKADRQVMLQTWRFDYPSVPSQYLAKALQDLASLRRRQGQKTPVKVWLMINVMEFQNKRKQIENMKRFIDDHQLNNPWVSVSFGVFQARLLGANHAKNLIVDNKVALITGANASKNFSSRGFFDVGFVVQGEVVDGLSDDFILTWKKGVSRNIVPQKKSRSTRRGCAPALLAKNDVLANLTRRPQSSSLNWLFMHSIQRAGKSIDIFTPNLNVLEFENVLLQAMQRGVKIRVILNKDYLLLAQSFPTRGGTNEQTVERIMRKLVKRGYSIETICKHLQIRWYSRDGRSPQRGSNGPTGHVKFMSIDNQVAYVGSANMDYQSWVNSREIGLLVDGRSLVRSWNRQVFEPYFKRGIPNHYCL